MHLIDIGRPSKTTEEMLDDFRKLQVNVGKDGKANYRAVKVDHGLDYTREFPEIALKYVDQIVTSYMGKYTGVISP